MAISESSLSIPISSSSDPSLIREAVTEHIKNMMLVMSASGVWEKGRDGVDGGKWRRSLQDLALWCPSLSDILMKFIENE